MMTSPTSTGMATPHTHESTAHVEGEDDHGVKQSEWRRMVIGLCTLQHDLGSAEVLRAMDDGGDSAMEEATFLTKFAARPQNS